MQFDVLLPRVLREMPGSKAANPPAVGWPALRVLSETVRVFALLIGRLNRGETGELAEAAREAAETASGGAGLMTGLSHDDERPQCSTARDAARRRRLAGFGRRPWRKEDGFTLSGIREL